MACVQTLGCLQFENLSKIVITLFYLIILLLILFVFFPATSKIKIEAAVVNKDDFLNSIKNLKPSIKPTDLKYFENLQNQFNPIR